MSSTLFEAAAERAVKTWKAYLAALCVLLLAFIIDWMSGSPFFVKGEPIGLANFKVVREALSATYGILFAVFVGAACQESRLLRLSVKDAADSSVARPVAIDLWFISPFSYSRSLRVLFWVSFVYGFGLLAFFSVIHLLGCWPPPEARMSHFAYRAIGAGDALVLAGCLRFALAPIYRNLQEVRRKLVPPPS
jgi:hypothetical protein